MARPDPSTPPSLLLLLFLVQLAGRAAATSKAPACQEITVPMCRGIGYNLTHMPNQFNHDTQDEAGLEVHQFWPLVEIYCSPDLRFSCAPCTRPSACQTTTSRCRPGARCGSRQGQLLAAHAPVRLCLAGTHEL